MISALAFLIFLQAIQSELFPVLGRPSTSTRAPLDLSKDWCSYAPVSDAPAPLENDRLRHDPRALLVLRLSDPPDSILPVHLRAYASLFKLLV